MQLGGNGQEASNPLSQMVDQVHQIHNGKEEIDLNIQRNKNNIFVQNWQNDNTSNKMVPQKRISDASSRIPLEAQDIRHGAKGKILSVKEEYCSEKQARKESFNQINPNLGKYVADQTIFNQQNQQSLQQKQVRLPTIRNQNNNNNLQPDEPDSAAIIAKFNMKQKIGNTQSALVSLSGSFSNSSQRHSLKNQSNGPPFNHQQKLIYEENFFNKNNITELETKPSLVGTSTSGGRHNANYSDLPKQSRLKSQNHTSILKINTSQMYSDKNIAQKRQAEEYRGKDKYPNSNNVTPSAIKIQKFSDFGSPKMRSINGISVESVMLNKIQKSGVAGVIMNSSYKNSTQQNNHLKGQMQTGGPGSANLNIQMKGDTAQHAKFSGQEIPWINNLSGQDFNNQIALIEIQNKMNNYQNNNVHPNNQSIQERGDQATSEQTLLMSSSNDVNFGRSSQINLRNRDHVLSVETPVNKHRTAITNQFDRLNIIEEKRLSEKLDQQNLGQPIDINASHVAKNLRLQKKLTIKQENIEFYNNMIGQKCRRGQQSEQSKQVE